MKNTIFVLQTLILLKELSYVCNCGFHFANYHTFVLKCTPIEYIFYYDGIRKVLTYLILICKIGDEDISGPYGDKLGKFNENTEFLVDYVRVYQKYQL